MSQSREPFNTQHELANLRKLKSDIEASTNEEEIFEHEVSCMAVIENACAGQKRMEESIFRPQDGFTQVSGDTLKKYKIRTSTSRAPA